MNSSGRIIKIIISSPLTWLAFFTILIVEYIFYWWFQPASITMYIAGGIGLFLLLLWPVFFTRSEPFYRFYYRISIESTESLEFEKIKALQYSLKELGSEQGYRQIRVLREKIESLNDVLKRRFNSGEFTFGRYLNTARHVYLSAIGNLSDIEVALRSINTVDVLYLKNRIRKLLSSGHVSDEQSKEIKTLKQRLLLQDQQLKKISKLHTQNESAITGLVNAATALADIHTGEITGSVDVETAMAELEILARQAGKYSTTDLK